MGDVSIEEAGAIVEAIKLFAPGKSWVLTISDMQHLGATSAGARSALVHATSLTRGAVFYGVTSRPQMLHALLAAAFTPAHRDADIPLLFFDAEAEAKAWLVERRRVLGAPRKQGA